MSTATGEFWLNAWYDPLANISTSTPKMRFADLNGDGESKLCICDHVKKKLVVYQNTQKSVESALLETPVAMCVTYTDSTSHIPSLAVAAGSHVFIYRQLRPYRKWTSPPVEISASESGIWADLKSGAITPSDAIRALGEVRDQGVYLTARSTELMTINGDDKRAAFVDNSLSKEPNYVQYTLITCMETLKSDSEDAAAVCHLVVGTENSEIIILPPDPVSSNHCLHRVKLPSPPVLIATAGQFMLDWRVTVICRDGKMYSVKNGDARGTAVLSGSVVELGSPAVSLARQDKALWVATMDRNVSCYTLRGKVSKRIAMPDDVCDMVIMSVKKAKVSHLLLVALANGEVRMYRDATLIHTFELESPVVALRFGSYGREENTLIAVHGRGALSIKIWRRTADVEAIQTHFGPPTEQDLPIPVPKKTKQYLEQSQREREQAPDIHRAFQRDLCRLRLETARAYVKTLTSTEMGTSLGSHEVRIQVKVEGLGPKFFFKIKLCNTGQQAILNTLMVFTYPENLYMTMRTPTCLQSPPLLVPLLLPGVQQTFEACILSIDPQGRAGQVLILLQPSAGSGSSIPFLSANVRMPASELLL